MLLELCPGLCCQCHLSRQELCSPVHAALKHSPGSSVLTGIHQHQQNQRAEPGSAPPGSISSYQQICSQYRKLILAGSQLLLLLQQRAVAHRGIRTDEAQKATEERNIPERKPKQQLCPNTPLFLFLVPRKHHAGCCWCWSPVLTLFVLFQ